MKDHEKRELVNALRDGAIAAHAAQSLREKLGKLVLTAIDKAVADERERCAGICDRLGHSVLAHVAAKEIRAAAASQGDTA